MINISIKARYSSEKPIKIKANHVSRSFMLCAITLSNKNKDIQKLEEYLDGYAYGICLEENGNNVFNLSEEDFEIEIS